MTSDAAAAVTEALRRLVGQFDLTEQRLVAGETEGVHNHRTTVRRLRSALSVFGEYYEATAAETLRAHLRDWGSQLGAARDHEVAAGRLEQLLAGAAAAESTGSARRRLVDAEREKAASARRHLIADLESKRHSALHRDLHRFVLDPPLRSDVTGKPKRLRRTLLREGRRVLRKAADMDHSSEARHEVRKAARRLRYAVEALTAEPVGLFGKRMAKVARRAHTIQALLGDHRDAVHTAGLAARAAVTTASVGEDTTVYAWIEQTSMHEADERLAACTAAIRRLAEAIDRARR